MKPIEFPEANTVFAKNQPEYQPLPAFYDKDKREGTLISCWELTEEEKLKLLKTGKIYISMMTFGHTMQPILPTVFKKDLFDVEETTEDTRTGVEIIAEERQRQINVKGYDFDHDVERHTNRELIRAAVCYCEADNMEMTRNEDGENLIESGYWPFDEKYFKPSPEDRIHELAKAGGLIASEIDRLKHIATNAVSHPEEVAGFNSAIYWEKRYAEGGNSGAGSSGELQLFKGLEIRNFIRNHPINTIIDWGCGDGQQLQAILSKDFHFTHYTGIDVSKTAIEKCKNLPFNINDYMDYFTFITAEEYKGERADLGLSLDVIYHLVEDCVFEAYMKQLCDSADRYLIIYASDGGKVIRPAVHLKERSFTKWMEENQPEWKLIDKIPNIYPYKGGISQLESISDFYFYERVVPIKKG
ncbi:MAG: class I SAM-dependent methyltransferase [Chloroflexota bacterium]